MRVTSRIHVRPRLVDLAVDRERGPVDGQLRTAGEHIPVLVDQHQVGHPDLAEVLGKRVDPEMVRVLRVTERDVAGHALIEALSREHAEGGGEVLLVVTPGGFGRSKGRR